MKTTLDQAQKEKLDELLKEEYFAENWKKIVGNREINTLEDIHDVLPKVIWRKKDKKYYESDKTFGYYALAVMYIPASVWSKAKSKDEWDAGYYNYESDEYGVICTCPGDGGRGYETGEEMIDALFELLLWLVDSECFITWDS